MGFEEKLDYIAELSQKIKAKEPPAFTNHHKQAATAMAELEKTVINLIMEEMSLKVIFGNLFYFWLTLEARLRNISEQKIDEWSMPLDKAVKKIVDIAKLVIDNLPDHQPTVEMEKLGEHLNELKANISDEQIDGHLLPEELAKQSTHVYTCIHTSISNLLKQSIHPEIVCNVLFGYWMRVSTLNAYVSEKYYQKMEFYFSEVIDAARKQIPILFQ